MSNEKIRAGDVCSAVTAYNPDLAEHMGMSSVYTAECRDAAGNLKWEDTIHNLLPNNGRALILNSFFGNTGGGAVVMGLKATGSAAYTDTQASHVGWLEVGLANAPTYSGNRKTPTFGSATVANPSVLTTSAAVVFTMTGSGTVAGCFINAGGSATIDNTTGTLVSAGDFTNGTKNVSATDTISVTWSVSLTG